MLDALVKALTPVVTVVVERYLDAKLATPLSNINNLKDESTRAHQSVTTLEGELAAARTEIAGLKERMDDMDTYSRLL